MKKVKIQKAPVLNRRQLSAYSRIGVLMDENTRRFCYDRIQKQLPEHVILEVQSGETNKNLATCEQIWNMLTRHGFDRHSLLIILGGGVLGDMGGFCASTYKRGIDFMLMPTTLLAQTDASVGGKLGIDFGSFKNHIGVFQLPAQTLIATEFLHTLPSRELRSGFAEIIKHCLISDRPMWNRLRRKQLEEQPWPKLVAHSVKFKTKVTAKDPREKGLRKILNFGHSLGHAIEGNFLDSPSRIFHGEAVAAGMVIESHIAKDKKMVSPAELEQISRYIVAIFGKIDVPGTAILSPLLRQDKKNRGNKVLMALPKGIGKALWDIPVTDQEIDRAIRYYQALQT